MQRRVFFVVLVVAMGRLVFSPRAEAKEEMVTLEISGMT